MTLGFGAIGWVDDYRKVVEKNPRGLPARWKYFWQSVVGLGAAIILYATATTPAETSLLIQLQRRQPYRRFGWLGDYAHCAGGDGALCICLCQR